MFNCFFRDVTKKFVYNNLQEAIFWLIGNSKTGCLSMECFHGNRFYQCENFANLIFLISNVVDS